MADTILERDLSPEEETLLRESLETFKEDVYSNLLEEVEILKEKKIEELEEANIEYREELKKEFANKLMTALKEMREEIKAEVLAEMVSSNPELQILESIKELVAPTLTEDFVGNVYAEQIQTLAEENEKLRREIELEEGAETLAELIAPYSEQTQNILLAVIKEGNAEEVTEQFYELIESMEMLEAEKEEDDDDEEEEEDDEKDAKKSDDEKDDDDEEEEDDEDDMDESYEGSYITDEDLNEDTEEEAPKNSIVSRILDLTK